MLEEQATYLWVVVRLSGDRCLAGGEYGEGINTTGGIWLGSCSTLEQSNE